MATDNQQDFSSFITSQFVDTSRKVKCMLGFFTTYETNQLYSYILLVFTVASNFMANLAEYGHFQGSWSVPRRSGSQVGRLRLLVDSGKMGISGKLGLLVVSGKLKAVV